MKTDYLVSMKYFSLDHQRYLEIERIFNCESEADIHEWANGLGWIVNSIISIRKLSEVNGLKTIKL